MSTPGNHPLSPSASVALTAADQIQVVEDATTERHLVAEAAGEGKEGSIAEMKKKPEPSLKNYIVSPSAPNVICMPLIPI